MPSRHLPLPSPFNNLFPPADVPSFSRVRPTKPDVVAEPREDVREWVAPAEPVRNRWPLLATTRGSPLSSTAGEEPPPASSSNIVDDSLPRGREAEKSVQPWRGLKFCSRREEEKEDERWSGAYPRVCSHLPVPPSEPEIPRSELLVTAGHQKTRSGGSVGWTCPRRGMPILAPQ
jgi:hypothetical protein